MSRSCSARLAHIAAFVGVACAVTSAPATGVSDMARCAAIAAAEARLACYDNLAAQSAKETATHTAATASSPSPRPTAPAAGMDDAHDFGFSPAKVHAAPQGTQVIHAHIAKISEDQLGRASVELDNGQTWAFTDEDGRLRTGDAITIKRASLGSFIMVTPSNHAYRARRLQ